MFIIAAESASHRSFMHKLRYETEDSEEVRVELLSSARRESVFTLLFIAAPILITSYFLFRMLSFWISIL
jgi:hypothetical protein